jgi:GTPase-associated system helical domain
MIHTSTELFPGWYNKGINKEASSDELTIRRKAISEAIKITKAEIWISFLKVFLKRAVFGSDEYNAVVELVKVGDDNFPIQNENLVTLLAGSIIAHKIDENDSYVADFLALALIITASQNAIETSIPEVFTRADFFWKNECEQKRRIDLDTKANSNSTVKITIPEPTSDPSTLKPHSDAVIKIISTIQKDLNSTNSNTNESLEIIKQQFLTLSEESNILWWLFTSYSNVLDERFENLTPELMGVVGPIELSNLTEKIPGVGGINSIFNKALSSTKWEKGTSVEVQKIISSIDKVEEKIKKSIPEIPKQILGFTSMIYGIQCRSEFAEPEWLSIYKKANSFDLSKKMSIDHFSQLLYQELMLNEVFKQINKE